MIRNILFLAILAPMAAIAQPKLEVVGGNVHDFYPEATVDTDCNIYLKNTGDSGLRIAYKKISVDYPAGWDVSLCDNRNCFFDFRDRDTFSALKAGEKTSMKITVFPKGVNDTARIKYAVWDIAKPNEIDTIEYNIFIRWGASTQNTSSEFWTMSPNPANDFLQLNTTGLNQISILNLNGQEIRSFKVSGTSAVLSLNGIQPGQYIVRGNGTGISRTQRLIKL